MENLFFDKQAAKKGQIIELCGLKFYPIQMKDYERYMSCKPALLLRQSTLPAVFAQLKFLEAVYAFDMETLEKTQQSPGIFVRLVELLSLALQINLETDFALTNIDNDVFKLGSILVKQNDSQAAITAKEFKVIRELIAEQNGDELPNEAENPELVKAEKDIAEIQSTPLNYEIEDLIESVAFNSHIETKQIYTWTIREFERRRKIIRRDKMHHIYAVAENSGMVKFPKGNPYPSYEFEKMSFGSSALTPENDFIKKYQVGADLKKP